MDTTVKLDPLVESKLTTTNESDSAQDEEKNDYADNQSIVLKKAELQAAQYAGSIYLTSILLFSSFVFGFGYNLDGRLRSVYTAYASSSYGNHSLISTIGVINAVITAASQIFYARLSDMFGRLSLFITGMVFYIAGTVIQSQAYDIQRYCAGAVFYNLGFMGITLMMSIILADLSTLRWRLLYECTPRTTVIIITWIAGDITSKIGPLTNWSWGIGMWAFIMPLSALPFVCCILHMKWLASKTPEWEQLSKRKSYYQKNGIVKTSMEAFWRLDAIGLLLLTVTLGCILVPLTLAGGVADEWKSGKIIGPLVLGWVLLPVFILYEAKLARYPLAPFKLLRDRGIWSALVLSFLINFVFYMVFDYAYTVLVVAINQTVKSATRIVILHAFVSNIGAPIFAVVVAYVRKLKGFLILGFAIWMVACGLFYNYRGGEYSRDGIIAAFCIWGLGTVFFSLPLIVALQAATSHKNLAIVAALASTMNSIGSAVGNSVSGAIWTQLLPSKLESLLGNATLAQAAYSSPFTFIKTYTWGTPEREAVVQSYRYIQRLETIVALCFCSLLVVFALFLRDPVLPDKVAQDEQLKEGEMVVTNDHDPIANFFRGIFKRDNHHHQDSSLEKPLEK